MTSHVAWYFFQPDSGRSRFVAHLSFLGLMTMKFLVLKNYDLPKISQQEHPVYNGGWKTTAFHFGCFFFRGHARFRSLSLGTAIKSWICLAFHSLFFFSIKPSQKYVQSKSNLNQFDVYLILILCNILQIVCCVFLSNFRAMYSRYTVLYFI